MFNNFHITENHSDEFLHSVWRVSVKESQGGQMGVAEKIGPVLVFPSSYMLGAAFSTL